MMRLLLCSLCITLSLLGAPSQADLRVDITQGHVAPLPIALVDFQASTPELAQIGRELTHVLTADLDRSGLFRSIDPAAFIQKADSTLAGPRFPDWRLIGAQALVIGQLKRSENGQLQLTFRLFDCVSQKQLEGLLFTAPDANWRRMAHIAADAVYKRLTGEEGYFNTRVVYVQERGSETNKKRQIAIMDQDGANHSYVTQTKSIVLTPRFSPTAQKIVYMDYGPNNRTPRVRLLDLVTKKHKLLGEFPGMTFAPRFSPDGKKVVMSFSQKGDSSLYEMDLVAHRVRRLTYGPVLDTSPCYSPDGKQLVFNSNRAGSRQLYVMRADGSDITRITFNPGAYATPVWSPRGDLIAFTKMHKGQFYIGVMRPDGSGERLITQGYIVEDPIWSPNGRVILFTRQEPSWRGGHTRLFTVDLTGHNEREVLTPADASGPAWSGRLG
ncbi:MAG: Tol-Pal system protein TolB [bacterium]|nr:Tol-Pal system protein TolB [bacterium]